jgi:hypothetical protein
MERTLKTPESPRIMDSRCIAAAVLILSGSCVLAELPAPAVRPLQSQDKSTDVIITIETSRAQPTAGGSFGLSAQIKNVSNQRIVITEKTTTLLLPPEVAGSQDLSDSTTWAYFPTESYVTPYTYESHLAIQPGDTYTVAWNWTTPRTEVTTKSSSPIFFQPKFFKTITDTVSSELQFMFFPPGDYKAAVILRYHVEGDPRDVYRTATQGAFVHIAAPQFVILFGAAIGGLLSYAISLLFSSDDAKHSPTGAWFNTKLVLRLLAGAVGSVLLSAIVTILLARLSETQFLIRVSINDFWGAIAIGFIANLGGIKLLEKILSKTNTGNGQAPLKTKSS